MFARAVLQSYSVDFLLQTRKNTDDVGSRIIFPANHLAIHLCCFCSHCLSGSRISILLWLGDISILAFYA